jgi:phosphoribosylformylglycinamidine synthase
VRFTDMCTARRFPHVRLGVVDDGGAAGAALDVQGLFSVPVAELVAAREATIPEALGLR